MSIQFTKMHGLGNDFMVIDAIHQKVDLSSNQITALSKRHTGIGFDQCLLIESSQHANTDFFYRIFNADGNEVAQCGNGARCLARFLHHYQLTDKRLITLATHTSRMQLQINDDESVTVNMGQPKCNPTDIPLLANTKKSLYSIILGNKQTWKFHAIHVGNPHAILVINDVATAEVLKLGKQMSEHALFPEQTNVGFMQVIHEKHIKLRVYERGCGETRACGSGAVAAVAVGRLYHQLAEKVQVSLPGGDLFVHWPTVDGDIFLRGPATFVYEGRLFS